MKVLVKIKDNIWDNAFLEDNWVVDKIEYNEMAALGVDEGIEVEVVGNMVYITKNWGVFGDQLEGWISELADMFWAIDIWNSTWEKAVNDIDPDFEGFELDLSEGELIAMKIMGPFEYWEIVCDKV